MIKDYDLSKLKTLKVDFIGDFKDQFSRAWMKTMTSQVRLETLEIWKQECQICPCDILDLQKKHSTVIPLLCMLLARDHAAW